VPEAVITVVPDYDAVSRAAAEAIGDVLRRSPAAKVLAATGQTPMGAYAELVKFRVRGTFDPARLQVYVLDEYVGAGGNNPRSLARWLHRAFVEPLGIPETNVVDLPPDGDAGACAAYDAELVRRGGFDLAILGIGTNGHIGFNEPPSDADAPTRLVTLSEDSLASNERYEDGGPVPRTAVTVGMAPLLASRACILLASGTSKADIMRRALLGPVGPQVPASFLQRHPDLTVIADRAAWPGGDGP
jgi:glucosamine-6-phosphate deaminase